MDVQRTPGLFFDVKITESGFYIEEPSSKPLSSGSAIATLRTIEEITKGHLVYDIDGHGTDRYAKLGKKELLNILDYRSVEIYNDYKKKESGWSYFIAWFKEKFLGQKGIETVLGNIEKSIKPKSELERAKGLGFEENDANAAGNYLEKLFASVGHYATQKVIDPKYLVYKGGNLDAERTINKMRSNLTTKDAFKILADSLVPSLLPKEHTEIRKIFTEDLKLKHEDDSAKNGSLALIRAAEGGDIDIIKFLLKHDVDPTAGKEGALCGAAENGHLEIVKILVGQGNVKINGEEGGKTPLTAACTSSAPDRVKIAEFLLTNGADSSILAKDGSSVLDLVYDRCAPGEATDELVDFLKGKGVTSTRLSRAKGLGFEGDDVRAAGEYLKKVFDSVKDYAKRGVIGRKYHVYIDNSLIDNSLDVDKTLKKMQRDLTKKDACKILAQNDWSEWDPKVSSELRKIVSENLMLQQGDEDVGEEGQKALILAACLGDVGIVKLLLKYNIASTAKAEALHNAVRKDCKEIVTILLQDNDVNINGEVNGATPFMTACAHGYLELAKFLLDKGADCHVVSRAGYNALDLLNKVSVYEKEDILIKNSVIEFLEGKGLEATRW